MSVSPLLNVDELRVELSDIDAELARCDEVEPPTPAAAERLDALRRALLSQRAERLLRIIELEREQTR